ncbi:hypothetical protein B0J18DRAFT_469959 [Chaetomium sp. MPI-SDFR-AT-0129]|nr:hypothetical protein B0J18DRAFT_469959 [Chaetomium sp. MPI-SDFR-AT-0129]
MRLSTSIALLSVLGVSALPTHRDPPGGGLHNPVEPPRGAVAVRNAAKLARITRGQEAVNGGGEEEPCQVCPGPELGSNRIVEAEEPQGESNRAMVTGSRKSRPVERAQNQARMGARANRGIMNTV